MIEGKKYDKILFQIIDLDAENGNGYQHLTRILIGIDEDIPSPNTFEKLVYAKTYLQCVN